MTEVIHRPAGALAVMPTQTDWTPDQRAALDAMGVDHEASEGDLKVFLNYVQKTQLDPFTGQIHMIGRNTRELRNGQWRWRKRYGIQVGIDGFRVIAQRSGKYRGVLPAQWCGPDGEWKDVWLDPDTPPVAARVGVRHADFPEPVYSVAMYAEYVPLKEVERNGQKVLEPMGLWGKMPAGQLAKCAEALADRKAFPNDLSGTYVPEEMDQANPAAVKPPPRTLTEILADAREAQDPEIIRARYREASAAGLLDEEVVNEDTGELLAVRAYLAQLTAALTIDKPATAAEATPDVQDAEVVEEWPTPAPIPGATDG